MTPGVEVGSDTTVAEPTISGDRLLALMSGFIVELRQAGLPVSLTENLDAMEAVKHIPLEERSTFKYALAATLVKNHAHWRVFETVFEVYFSYRGRHYSLTDDATGPDVPEDDADLPPMSGSGEGNQGGTGESMSPEELAEMLFQSLMKGDDALMRAVARQSVRRFAGMEPGRPVGACPAGHLPVPGQRLRREQARDARRAGAGRRACPG